MKEKTKKQNEELEEPKPTDSITIKATFTRRQIELIDALVNSGELGQSRAEVINKITILFLNEKSKKPIFS
jgi:hypothetical protein